MLMECLAAGRSISLPSSAVGYTKLAARAVGAYARVRSQFKTPIGKFEGIEEAMARIGGNLYLMDAARKMTAGAVDLGAPFLAALRARCDETCALMICDEVQCGMGRTGFPFAAGMHGISPDMITTAKALGAGFPCSALLMADHVAAHLKTDDLGTTFGGGPMACAMIEAVVGQYYVAVVVAAFVGMFATRGESRS
jgi:glutamate-1-semialdehyde aminotransferase